MSTGTYKLKLMNFYNPYKKGNNILLLPHYLIIHFSYVYYIIGTTNQFYFETMEPGVNTVIE
jgi:hypothetical protein